MASRPNVVVIMADSLRWDKVDARTADGKPVAPRLAELMEESTTFTEAITPSNWTLPTHTSLFTGLYPQQHGMWRGQRSHMPRLPKAIPTLAELLSEGGYKTLGLTNNPWVGWLSGLDRGHQYYQESTFELNGPWRFADAPLPLALANLAKSTLKAFRTVSQYAPMRAYFSKLTTRVITRWIDRVGGAGDEPYYVFANYMDVHGPYFPTRKNLRDIGSPKRHHNTVSINYALYRNIRKREEYSAEMKEDVHTYYHASLRNFDDELGKLIDHLKERGDYDNTLFVLTADHGKILGEHSRSDTICYSREIMIRVPIVVRYPKGFPTGLKVGREVNLTDLFYTILQTAGLYAKGSEGRRYKYRLQDAVSPIERQGTRIDFSMTVWPWAATSDEVKEEFYIARDRRYKLIRSPRHGDLFYDLEEDPMEERDLPDHPEKARFQTALEAWNRFASDDMAKVEEADDEMEEEIVAKMRELGYMD